MAGKRLSLILKNNGNCLFCQSPSQSGDNPLRPLLHSLQIKQVPMEVQVVGASEPVQVIQVDLQGLEIKTGLCTECSNLNLAFHSLKQKMEACLTIIKAKVKVGSEKDCGGMKYPSMEGAIARETLNRLNVKEPHILLQDFPLSVRSIDLRELNDVKVDVDVTGYVIGLSSTPISEGLMEGSSFTQSQKGKRKSESVSNAPDPTNDQIAAMNKRSRASARGNSPLASFTNMDGAFSSDDEFSSSGFYNYLDADQDYSSFGSDGGNQSDNFETDSNCSIESFGSGVTMSSEESKEEEEAEESDEVDEEPGPTTAEISASILEEVKRTVKRDVDAFNSTCEQELLLNAPTYPATSLLSYLLPVKDSMYPESIEGLPGCYLEGDCFVFKTNEGLQMFLDKTANHSPELNPFLGNSVRIHFADKKLNRELVEQTGMNIRQITNLQRETLFNRFLANVQKLFEKFGSHIHNLQIKRSKLQFKKELSFEKPFTEILHFLRNLKELEIVTKCSAKECRCKSNLLVLPPDLGLPLEYLGLDRTCDDSISKLMINRYGHQLRKLIMPVGILDIEQLLSQPLSQLQELTIFYSDVDFISKLKRFAFPNLSKLAMKECHSGCTPQKFLPLLRNFPKLKYLEIEPDKDMSRSLKCKISNFREEYPELEYFAYPFLDKCNYDFLLKFPNLKQIRFLARLHWNYKIGANKSDIFPDLREKILTNKMYESNIWDKLPKLNRVCIDWEGDVKNFNTLEYNRLQQLFCGGQR